jgi:hypothetical protein
MAPARVRENISGWNRRKQGRGRPDRAGAGLSRTHASGRWLGSLPQGSPKGDMSGSEGGTHKGTEGSLSGNADTRKF